MCAGVKPELPVGMGFLALGALFYVYGAVEEEVGGGCVANFPERSKWTLSSSEGDRSVSYVETCKSGPNFALTTSLMSAADFCALPSAYDCCGASGSFSLTSVFSAADVHVCGDAPESLCASPRVWCGSGSRGLSDGAIVGISVGGGVFVLGAAVFAYLRLCATRSVV